MPQVVEIAPAYGLDETVRQRLHEDAVRLAKHVGYVRLMFFKRIHVFCCRTKHLRDIDAISMELFPLEVKLRVFRVPA